jgi:hydrogenase maturation protease
MKNPVVVLGLGNPLMADEGIGVHLIERLTKRAAQYPGVDFVDAGTASLSVLHLIEGRRKAIFVDCAFMDEEPGVIRRFTPGDVRSTKVLSRQSLHETDLLRILCLARQLDQVPEQVVIFGIQPERVAPGTDLSAALSTRIDAYLSQILCELHV